VSTGDPQSPERNRGSPYEVLREGLVDGKASQLPADRRKAAKARHSLEESAADITQPMSTNGPSTLAKRCLSATIPASIDLQTPRSQGNPSANGARTRFSGPGSDAADSAEKRHPFPHPLMPFAQVSPAVPLKIREIKDGAIFAPSSQVILLQYLSSTYGPSPLLARKIFCRPPRQNCCKPPVPW
jgi:hypothetical protein